MLDDWLVTTCEQNWIYNFPESSLDSNRLAIIGNLDMEDVMARRACPGISEIQLGILTQFTALVHDTVFNTKFPSLAYNLFYCIVSNSDVLWEYMESCCGPLSGDARGQQNCPCIVWSRTAERLYRVESVIFKSPEKYCIQMDQWGDKDGDIQVKTLSEYYREKYNISVHSNQNVFVSRLGSPILSAPLSAHAKMVPRTKGSRSQIYLIPELVVVHPLSGVDNQLSFLARHLFWVESGLIAQSICDQLVATSASRFVFWGSIFIPTSVCAYNSRQVMLMHVALTCPSAQLKYSYDKLEWLGDAVWRFAASLAGLHDFSIRTHFNVLLSNERMGDVCSRKFPRLVESSILSNPPTLKSPQTARSRLRNLNILADVIEAIIAVSFIHGGLASVSQTIHRLGLLDTEDLPVPLSKTHSVESFFNSAVSQAFWSLKLSLELVREYSSDTVGQLTERRRVAITKHKSSNTFSFANMPACTTDWEEALL